MKRTHPRPLRAALSVACLAAAAVAAVAPAPPADALPRLKVAYNQWAGFAPVFVAADKGFFKDEGIDVRLIEFEGPGDSLAPLLAGHVDVSLTTTGNLILMNARGGDIKCVYLLDTSSGADAVVAKKSIAGPADLKGKTVAVTVGEVNQLLLADALESAGLTLRDVHPINMDPDDAGAVFIAGHVDAAVTWEPWVSKAQDDGDGHVIFSSADTPNLLLDVIAVSGDTLDRREHNLVALCRAIQRGMDYMQTHPAEAYAIAGKWLGASGPQVVEMLRGVRLYNEQDNLRLFETREPILGPMLEVATFMQEQGQIKQIPNLPEILDGAVVDDLQ